MSTVQDLPVDESALCQEPSRNDLSRDQRLSLGRKLNTMKWVRDRIIVMVIALVIAIAIRTFLFSVFLIPSESMAGTLASGDRIGVSKLTPDVLDVQRGDVIVFSDPGGWIPPEMTATMPESPWWITTLTVIGVLPAIDSDNIAKRVIGLPGDHVVCCDSEGHLSINNVPVTEGYIQIPVDVAAASDINFDVIVPAGHMWVLGDNRYDSADSRFHLNSESGGFVPIENVVGRAFVTVWPFDRIGLVPKMANTYIPDATAVTP